MKQASVFYCDWCKMPILLQKTIDHIVLPACSHIMHAHKKGDCKARVQKKADIHCDILSAFQHGFIDNATAESAMMENLLTYPTKP